MGCCASTPTSSSPRTSPYDDPAATIPNTRAITNHSSANASATAGLTAHAAPGPASSRQNVDISSDSPRLSVHHETERKFGPGTPPQHVDGATASSPTSAIDIPNRPLRLPPQSHRVPIPPTLSLQTSRPRSTLLQPHNDDPDAILTPNSPTNQNVPMLTRSLLERERTAFFDTRWSGRAEVWAAVRLLCESLRQQDIESAQAILDAAGLTCPSGDVWAPGADGAEVERRESGRGWRRLGRGRERDGGVYDELGERYQVPLWVVADPEGIIEGGEDQRDIESGTPRGGDAQADKDDGYSDEDDDDIILSKEKGKGREVDVGKVVKVRARLSDRGTDVVIRVGLDEPVVILRRKVKEAAELQPRSRVKFAYLGKILEPSLSLSAQGWREGHVVNALVFRPP